MVAPVRESCAQVLGVMSVHLPETLVTALARNLLSLLEYSEWTVNHGALLGLKYLIAARLDLTETLLPLLYGPISSRLKDSCDDDVRCAAAAALMPIFSRSGAVAMQSSEQLEALKLDLWQLLALRPDYTSPGATIAVLQLLEKLYEQQRQGPSVASADQHVASAVNRLHWCYYSYSEAVRLAAVRTCDALLRSMEARLAELSLATVCQVLCQLFQRVLVDDSGSVAVQAELLWGWLVDSLSCDALAQACLERLDVWMCCAMQPARLSYAPGALLLLSDTGAGAVATDTAGAAAAAIDECKLQLPKEFFIGGRDSFLAEGDSPVREEAVLRARTAACRMLARLCRALSRIAPLAEHILVTILARIHLKERLAVQRFVAATILAYWQPAPDWVAQQTAMLAPLRLQLLAALEEPLYYQELLPAFRHMAKACRDLVACYALRGVATGVPGVAGAPLSLAQCQALLVPALSQRLSAEEDTGTLAVARTAVDQCGQQHVGLTRLVDTALARALLEWGWLPDLLTPLIRPLTDAVRCDGRAGLQTEAASALAQLLVDYSFVERLAAPAGKLLRNVVQYLSDAIDAVNPASAIGPQEIVALARTTQLGREAYPCQEDTSGGATGIGTPETAAAAIKLRGAQLVLEKMCGRLCASAAGIDGSLLLRLVATPPCQDQSSSATGRLATLAALRAMTTCLPHLGVAAHGGLVDYATRVFQHGLGQRDALVRHWSARVLAGLIMPPAPPVSTATGTIEVGSTSRDLVDALLLGEAVATLDAFSSDSACLGAIELVYLVMHRGPLSLRLALVGPLLPAVLRCVSAPVDAVRRLATHLFSLLLALLPLEQAGADVAILSAARRQQRLEGRHFTEGLLRPDALPSYDAHVPGVTASLRHYQQQGLNWLAFLNRYGLHGVLADDMGLGKTLQALCIVVGEHQRALAHGRSCGPSLVVCPPTLTRHWQQEIARHVSLPQFDCMVYAGPVETRQALLATLHRYQIVITSYDILRNDIERISRPPKAPADSDSDATSDSSSGLWNYLVLDEGHLIRNHKSKLAVAAKTVCARHRLVLTGTPIQNRVAELWSLFDFLMPGLLGSHADFHRRYGRWLGQASSPTTTGAVSAGAKRSSAAAGATGDGGAEAAGTLALEQLHRQVLPFMLRRVKEDVLHELPPKIIQDYMCTMTPLQARLYAHCLSSSSSSSSDTDSGIADSQSTDSSGHPKQQQQHVFQALHRLRQVCNHPRLALSEDHPLYGSVRKELAAGGGQSLDDVALSGKLVALRYDTLAAQIDDCLSLSPSV